MQPRQQRLLQLAAFEEAAAGARVDDAAALTDHAEARSRRVLVLADDHHGARAHVLLLADDLRDALVEVVVEGLLGVLQQVGLLAGLARRHGRRQVDQPFGIGGEAAHHLQRRGGVLFADGHVAAQARLDDALAEHVVDVQHIVVFLLHRQFGRLACRHLEGPRRLVVRSARGHRDKGAFWIAQRGQAASEDAAGVDVDGVVEPVGPGHGREFTNSIRIPCFYSSSSCSERQHSSRPGIFGLMLPTYKRTTEPAERAGTSASTRRRPAKRGVST